LARQEVSGCVSYETGVDLLPIGLPIATKRAGVSYLTGGFCRNDSDFVSISYQAGGDQLEAVEMLPYWAAAILWISQAGKRVHYQMGGHLIQKLRSTTNRAGIPP